MSNKIIAVLTFFLVFFNGSLTYLVYEANKIKLRPYLSMVAEPSINLINGTTQGKKEDAVVVRFKNIGDRIAYVSKINLFFKQRALANQR